MSETVTRWTWFERFLALMAVASIAEQAYYLSRVAPRYRELYARFGRISLPPMVDLCVSTWFPLVVLIASLLLLALSVRPHVHSTSRRQLLLICALFSGLMGYALIRTGGSLFLRPHYAPRAQPLTQLRRPRAGAAYHHLELGYNYRLSNVLAGIGRGQLEVLDDRVRARRAVAARYREAFADLPGLELMPEAPYGLSTRWLTCVRVDREALGVSRDDLLAALAARDIEARPLWKPMHLQPLYAQCDQIGGAVCEELFERGLCLPSSSSLSVEEQDRVIEAIRGAARGA